MPLLEAIFQKYEPLGFTLLAVNVEENSADGEAFLRDRPVSFPVLYDPDNQVSKLFDVIAMPSTVLIDRQPVTASEWRKVCALGGLSKPPTA